MNTLEPIVSAQPNAVVPRREPLVLRALRGLALVALVLALTFLVGLWVLSLPPMMALADSLGGYAGRSANEAPLWARITFMLLALLPIGLVMLARRLKLRSWWWVGGGWLAVIPVFAYLATDEPSRRTIKLEEMAPAFPGAEKSYAVLMRYSKVAPVPEALAMEKVSFKLVGLPVGPDKPAEFAEFVQARRADIDTDWALLEPQRRWLDELNAFDRIGDLGAADVSTNIIRFSAWRLLSQRATAKAGLLAMDGQGDAAFTTILPLLEASRKLEPSARTLVRFMVARVVQKMLIEVAAFTLDRTTVAPELRARMATALRLGVGGEAGVRRLVAVDYAGVAGWLSNSSLGSGMWWDGKGGAKAALFDVCGPFLYNRNRTLNLHGDLIAELQELAARREAAKLDLRAAEFWRNEGRPTFKNFYGRALNMMTFTPLSKVVDSYWRIEDARLALIRRLETS